MAYASTEVILETDSFRSGEWQVYFGRDAQPPTIYIEAGSSSFTARLDWAGDVPRIAASIRDGRHRYRLHTGHWTLDPGQRCGPGTLLVRLRVLP